MKVEINNTTSEEIDEKLIRNIVENFLKKYKKENSNISIAFVDNQEIQKLNKKYRQLDKPTDVLSFEGEGDFLGEIIISYEQATKQAKKLEVEIKDEITYVLVHGLFHLIGYEDETEEDSLEMKKLADDFISGLQIK